MRTSVEKSCCKITAGVNHRVIFFLYVTPKAQSMRDDTQIAADFITNQKKHQA
jgi:hypothetical protein